MDVFRDCSVCFDGDPLSPDLKCCFNCAFNADTCEVRHRCGEDCKEWVSKDKTNADRIRSMSDERLAKFLSGEEYVDSCNPNLCLDGETCEGCVLEWLKKPYDGK